MSKNPGSRIKDNDKNKKQYDFAWPLPLAGVRIHVTALHNDAGILGAAAQCLERMDLS